MKNFLKYFLLLPAQVAVCAATGQGVERAEPLNWWIGMKTPLQIMFYGEEIGRCGVEVLDKGIAVERVHRADSPNYLFVDVSVAGDAAPGDYTFEFTRGTEKSTFEYHIGERRKGSAMRESFTSADLVYLIMPDRFANGDTSNDETECTIEGIDRNNFHGRHGGDIRGIMNHLDYMAGLGVTALWSTPLTLDNEPVYSYHGYACADYYRIDPRFGTNALYREMVAEAHRRGIKIVMDVVTNHCGTAHWWMDDLPFGDWINQFPGYTRSNTVMAIPMAPNASRHDADIFYRGWFDRSMPDMNLDNPFMLNYFKQWITWWIEEMDIDGLRIDTYPFNSKLPMVEWVASVRREYPNMGIVGECWHTSPSQIAYWMAGQDNRDGFEPQLPMLFDFPLSFAVNDAMAAEKPVWEKGTMGIYNILAQDFLYPDPHGLMIFLDNHDTEHFADRVNGDVDRIKMGITLLATLRGIPQMLTGTELGFRSLDLGQGHGSARIDFSGGWPGDERDLFTDTGRSPSEREIFDHARKLFLWRRDSPVVHKGALTQFHNHDNSYLFIRHDDRKVVVVVVNNNTNPKVVDWNVTRELTGGLTTGRDVISGKSVSTSAPLIVAPYESVVVEFDTAGPTP